MTDPLDAPLLLTPRLDTKPWGGRRLAQFGFNLPPGVPIGEAVITAPESIVSGRSGAAGTLGELTRGQTAAVLGERGLRVTGGRPLFPVLLKLIDANEDLSIQVHPDDAAAAPTGELGKTESFFVLDGALEAAIAVGLRQEVSPARFAAACRAGESTAPLLRWLPARAGESILIPAGTVHALGAGCLIFEVQQPSEITYRLDDWHRLGVDGKPRALHIEPGLAVYDPASRPAPNAPVRLGAPDADPRREALTACRYYAIERVTLTGSSVTSGDGATPQTFTLLSGRAHISTGGGVITANAGETALVTAGAGVATLESNDAVVLRGWVPDLAVDIVAPALAAGEPVAAIGALAGFLPDLRDLLAASPAGTKSAPRIAASRRVKPA